MSLQIPADLLAQIRAHGKAAYPEEGAGFLLGRANGEQRVLVSILPAENRREDSARHKRYLLGPQQLCQAEETAQRLGLDLIGVFHSHPNHPAQPSAFDRDWALPWFSYVITRVDQGQAIASRSWRLAEDRQDFVEESIVEVNEAISEKANN
ncbi:MAG: M67 family metallopeptidase [Anaerolineales bacterium]